MNTENQIILASLFYKFLSLISGLFLCYLGFKLFMKRIEKPTGELSLESVQWKINLKNAAPGIYFSLFGSIIISATLIKGLSFNKSNQATIINDTLRHSEKSSNITTKVSDTILSNKFSQINNPKINNQSFKKDNIHIRQQKTYNNSINSAMAGWKMDSLDYVFVLNTIKKDLDTNIEKNDLKEMKVNLEKLYNYSYGYKFLSDSLTSKHLVVLKKCMSINDSIFKERVQQNFQKLWEATDYKKKFRNGIE